MPAMWERKVCAAAGQRQFGSQDPKSLHNIMQRLSARTSRKGKPAPGPGSFRKQDEDKNYALQGRSDPKPETQRTLIPDGKDPAGTGTEVRVLRTMHICGNSRKNKENPDSPAAASPSRRSLSGYAGSQTRIRMLFPHELFRRFPCGDPGEMTGRGVYFSAPGSRMTVCAIPESVRLPHGEKKKRSDTAGTTLPYKTEKHCPRSGIADSAFRFLQESGQCGRIGPRFSSAGIK